MNASDPSPVELYLAYLEEIFGQKPEFYGNASKVEGLPGVASMVFQHTPMEGLLTGCSYGLSLIDHPEWKVGRPELCLTVRSHDLSWAQVVGYLANELRGECPFVYGNTIDFGEQISKESEMNAFLIFPPAGIPANKFLNVDIGTNYRLNINGLFPIYQSEIAVYNEIGPEAFYQHPNFDIYNVQRNRID